jgi:fructooligosaccharide transport system substrate-binding protein
MKRVNCIVCLLMLTSILLGACSPTAPAATTVATTAADTAVPAASGNPTSAVAATEPIQHEPVTITFWHSATISPLDSTLKNQIDQFMEKYPWITVNAEGIAFADYFTKVDTATAGGTAPDVLWVDHTVVPKYAYYQTIIPLDQYLPEGYKDDWFPSTMVDSTYDGKIWAIPLHQSTEAIMYNQDLIDAAGLTVPTSYDAPWTFDEFRQALEKVSQKSADGSVTTWGFLTNYALSVYNWQPWIMAQGGTLMDPDLTTFDGYLNSDTTVEASTWFANLYRDQLAPIETTADMFQTGKVAFFQSNPFGITDVQNRYPDLKFGVMPMPCDETCAVDSGQWEIGISSQSKNPDAAWLLVDFLTNYEGEKEWVTSTGYLPARQSVYESMPELKEYPLNIFMDGLINYAVHRPASLAYQYFNSIMMTTIKDFNNGADVKTGLDKVAEDAQKQLDSMK